MGKEQDDYYGVCSGFVLRDFRVPKATGVHEKVWGCAPEVLMRCKSRMLESHSFEHFVIFFFNSLLRYRVQQAVGFLVATAGL